MTKLIALVAAGIFATGTVFAGEHHAKGEGKMACEVSMADMNLTPDQKTKMDAAMAEHHKAGCSKESEEAYMKEAKQILTKDQYAKFKADCKGKKEKGA